MDTFILENHKFKGMGSLSDYYAERVLFTRRMESDWDLKNSLYVNFPMYNYMAQVTMDETMIRYLLIKVKDRENHTLIKKIAEELNNATSDAVKTHIVSEEKSDMSKTMGLLNMLFSLIIVIMMSLSFFSLISSTTANLFD